MKPLELIEKVKSFVFDTNRHWLCDHFCNLDGYCPTYDCGSLDKLKRYNDRQWLNSITKTLKVYPNIDFEDLVMEVVDDLWHKQPAPTHLRRLKK